MLQLSRFDSLFSSNLLEAELRSALAREGEIGKIKNLLAWMSWVYPSRRLTQELDSILEIGKLKGSDLWHLACAIFLRRKMGPVLFLTLDRGQGEIARSLGFPGLRPLA